MLEAQAVQRGGLQVVDVNFVFQDAEAEVVGFADYLPAFDAAASRRVVSGVRGVASALI